MEEKRIFSDNNYWVTDDGRIICYYGYKMKEINQYSTVGRKEKYKTVSLNINGRQRLFYVHRLVAEAFIDNPYNYPQVNHKDRNPSNNHVGNLEWVTAQENINHAYLTDEYKECAICKERIWSKKSNLCMECKNIIIDKIERIILYDTKHSSLEDLELSQMTDRQRDVLSLISKGYSQSDIARELKISRERVGFLVRKCFKQNGEDENEKAALKTIEIEGAAQLIDDLTAYKIFIDEKI